MKTGIFVNVAKLYGLNCCLHSLHGRVALRLVVVRMVRSPPAPAMLPQANIKNSTSNKPPLSQM